MGVNPYNSDTTNVKQGGLALGAIKLNNLIDTKKQINEELQKAINSRNSTQTPEDSTAQVQDVKITQLQTELSMIEREINVVKKTQSKRTILAQN